MEDDCKPNLRIDWFDGTIIEDRRPSTSVSAFADENKNTSSPESKSPITEKKPIGFKRLQDISYLEPPVLNLEVSHRPGFWNLFDSELKDDFIVLIVKTLAKVYNSLDSGEKSKLAGQLKSRLEPSVFIDVLKSYVEGLPTVRVVEKRMNLQLWDDVETFFSNVLKLCEGILKFERHSKDFMIKVFELVNALEASMLGVIEEHTETINPSLFTKIQELRIKLLKVVENDFNKKLTIVNTDPLHYTNLNIFPSKEDLFDQNSLQIRPNIVNGAYPTVEDYLDLQFKLLREDCFGPLREGISMYRENPRAKTRHENIRVNPKVRIIRIHVSNNKVGHLVDIAWEQRIKSSIIEMNIYNKQLLFGSLLLFTNDDFKTILCATVLDSNAKLLSEGYIAVQFQNAISNKIFTEAYTMVESEVFFEPYHRVLKVLQETQVNDLPMRKYIVDVQKETQPPKYLLKDTTFSINNPKKELLSFNVLDLSKWPKNTDFDLDISQMEAFKLALTREFAVIQGPPGTGKTFIGIKIASTILKNISLQGTPMLIICYTNHALDQFLEGILQTTTNVVRLGSQSKSKTLEPYNLNALRTKTKSKYSYLYVNKRKELEKIFNEMVDLQSEIEKCENNILCYKSIKKYIGNHDQNVDLKSTTKDDPILMWLFNEIDDQIESDEEDWEKHFEDAPIDYKLNVCLSEKSMQKEIDSLNYSKKYVEDITNDESERQIMLQKFECEIDKIKNRLKSFKQYWTQYKMEGAQMFGNKATDNLRSLKQEDRWRLYFNAVHKITNELIGKMNELQKQHNTVSNELEEVSTLIDNEVMKSTQVVGVTTTTAARRHNLMKALASPIVIVEEAAEVLEAHIVASLTHHCQHVILIGDHKQLRPTAAHYKLAKNYNLEISLFERMIRNGVHSRTLSIQRRMRPNFVELLVPIVYEKLDSHETVYRYPNVRGMADNLYFYNHGVLEDSEGQENSWSHKNYYEAKWCVALANYLRKMKYESNEVTILATYTGQATLIRELSKKYDTLRDIKITVVDNYQGEESRIVILSLVRSNRDGRIGFLTAANRICVALSRAREGFYIFGNMDILKTASNIWRQIGEKLRSQNAIGCSLRILCDRHNENICEIQRSEDLDSCFEGQCLKMCKNKKTGDDV